MQANDATGNIKVYTVPVKSKMRRGSSKIMRPKAIAPMMLLVPMSFFSFDSQNQVKAAKMIE